MTVELNRDTREMAEAYDKLSNVQYKNGCLLMGELGTGPGDCFLDIGCGTGRLGRHAIEILGRSGRYIGIDPLADRIALAREKNCYENAEFRIGVAENLEGIADSSVDVVVLNSVFHWVMDKPKALAEIQRVLKAGGKVGITTSAKEINAVNGVNRYVNTIVSRKPYADRVKPEESFQHKHALTTTELIQLAFRSGLKIVDVHVRPNPRAFSSVEELINFSEASSFGNFLNHVPEELREQAKRDVMAEMTLDCTAAGVVVEFYMSFLIAAKA